MKWDESYWEFRFSDLDPAVLIDLLGQPLEDSPGSLGPIWDYRWRFKGIYVNALRFGDDGVTLRILISDDASALASTALLDYLFGLGPVRVVEHAPEFDQYNHYDGADIQRLHLLLLRAFLHMIIADEIISMEVR